MGAWPIYIGSVDDEVAKYPWSQPITNKYIDAIMLKCLLVGQNPIINDGHLFQNNHLRNLVFEKPSSYITHLVEHSFVWISQRTPRISDLPSVLASKGNLSFQHDFSTIDVGVRRFESVLERVKQSVITPDADKISSTFTQLASETLDAPINDLEIVDNILTYDIWKRFSDYYNLEIEVASTPSRQQWIFSINRLLADQSFRQRDASLIRRKLMNLANEIHHINTAKSLHAGSSTKVGVETGARPWTRQFLMEDDVLVSSPESFGSILSVPWPNSILAPESIDKLLSRAYDVGRSRDEFINILSNYRHGSASIEELKESGHSYSSLLYENFSRPLWTEATTKILSLSLAAVTFGLTTAVTMSPVAGGVAAALIWGLDQTGPRALAQLAPAPRLIDRLVERAGTVSDTVPTVAVPHIKTISASLL